MTPEARTELETSLLSSTFYQHTAHAPFMRPEILSLPARRMLSAILGGLGQDGLADPVLVEIGVKASSNGNEAHDIDYLTAVIGSDGRTVNAESYAARLAAEYRRSQAALAARAAADALEAEEPAGSVLEHLRAATDTLTESGPEELPEPLDLAAILAGESAPSVPWAVCGLFAEQDVLVIGGEGGTGKSIVALDLAIALSSGQPLLGMQVTSPQPVLYLDEENQQHVAARRIYQHLRGRSLDAPPPGLTYILQAGLTYDTREARERIAKLIDLHRPRWVVLDSYVRFRGGDENSNTDAAEFASALKAERCRSGVGWIILTHLAKPSKDRPDPVHRIRGASDIVNSSDALLTLEGDRATDRRTLTPQQRRTSTLAPISICWRESEDQDSAQLLSLGTETMSAEQAVERALRLAEHAGVQRPQLKAICEREGYSDPEKAIGRVLGRLTAAGRIKTAKEGKFLRVWLTEFAPKD